MNEDTRSAAISRERAGFELVSPKDVLAREDLTREQKIELLREWEHDIRERMVAEEENMAGAEPLGTTLALVLDSLRALGSESAFHDVDTKHA